MAAIKKTRVKAAALIAAPQSRDECARWIAALGHQQRDLARLQAAMNDEIGAVTETYQPGIDTLSGQIKQTLAGIQTWCEAHRDEITEGGKTKSGNLVTGNVQWRQRPPSIAIRGAEAVMDTLDRLGLGRFIRMRREPNKEAMLNEPDVVRGVAGISIVTGVEDFVVTPFEQESA